MIRKFAAAVVVAAIVSLGAGVPADAIPFRPDPISYEQVASFYKCGEFKRGPHVGGYLYRTAFGYIHTRTLQSTSHPFVTCTR